MLGSWWGNVLENSLCPPQWTSETLVWWDSLIFTEAGPTLGVTSWPDTYTISLTADREVLPGVIKCYGLNSSDAPGIISIRLSVCLMTMACVNQQSDPGFVQQWNIHISCYCSQFRRMPAAYSRKMQDTVKLERRWIMYDNTWCRELLNIPC